MSQAIGHIEILPGPLALAYHVAEWMTQAAMAARGPFRVSLWGGSTLKTLYGLLASDEFRNRYPWQLMSGYRGDERFVHDDSESNFWITREAMLAKVPVPLENIHPIVTDGTFEDSARSYERTLQKGVATLDPHRPLFDIFSAIRKGGSQVAAARFRPVGQLLWFVDRAAAGDASARSP